jgi:gluconate 2-dehydrogenase alpha chain
MRLFLFAKQFCYQGSFDAGEVWVENSIADVCIVGVGGLGGILAKQLSTAGLKVVGFERGPIPQLDDYAARDAIKFVVRPELSDWSKHEPTTTRKRPGDSARLHFRTSPLNVLGGALLHWTGQSSRYMPGDFKLFTNEIQSGNAERAGADVAGYDIIDWPLSYDDLEPYYEKFEWEFGISGAAGKNPFAGPRKRDFPLPPLRHSAKMELFAKACRDLGYHAYDTAAGILSEPYRPPEPYDPRIPERPACVYCGHCNFYGCHVHAKSASLYTVIPVALQTGNFELRANSKVFHILSDDRGIASGVRYFDPDGQAHEQRARVVILSAFVFEHVRLLLLSKTNSKRFAKGLANSSGYVGRNIMAHGDVRAMGVFDDYIINGFIGPGFGRHARRRFQRQQLRSRPSRFYPRRNHRDERRRHSGNTLRCAAAGRAILGRGVQEILCALLHPDDGLEHAARNAAASRQSCRSRSAAPRSLGACRCRASRSIFTKMSCDCRNSWPASAKKS